MAKNSAVNLDITNNADGFDVSGGTTIRKLTVTGAGITLTGSGTNVYTFPLATTGLLGRAPNVQSITSAATITPNANTDDLIDVTALATGATFAASSGTAANGQYLRIKIITSGATAYSTTWANATYGYTAGGATLPTRTLATGKTRYMEFMYNTANSVNRWILTYKVDSI